MIKLSEIAIERIFSVAGKPDTDFEDLAIAAVDEFKGEKIGGVIAASFSNPMRFPSLAVKAAGYLGLDRSVPAFDIQMACSAYPYAVYLAGKLASDLKAPILVIDGDVQTKLVNREDHATGDIFSDAMTTSLITSSTIGESKFDFLSSYDSEALTCASSGPIHMDGFKVFTFVATEISEFLRKFGNEFDIFAPHQANAYMIRQLAKSLNLEDKLVTTTPEVKNSGSCSVAMALEKSGRKGRALIAGFGAGYSAAAGIVRIK